MEPRAALRDGAQEARARRPSDARVAADRARHHRRGVAAPRAGTADRSRAAAAVDRRHRVPPAHRPGYEPGCGRAREGGRTRTAVSWPTGSRKCRRRCRSSPTSGRRCPTALFRGVLAALDTAAFRVDPWLTGIAERRLQRMIADRGAVPPRRVRLGRCARALHGRGRRSARARTDARRAAACTVARAGADGGDASRCRGSLSERRRAGS